MKEFFKPLPELLEELLHNIDNNMFSDIVIDKGREIKLIKNDKSLIVKLNKLSDEEFNILVSQIPKTDKLNRAITPNSLHRISVMRDHFNVI